MAVDTTNLATQVQNRIDNLSGSETLDELLVLRKSADNLGLTLTAIESAIETKLNAFDGATVDEDLLIGNRAASLSESGGGGVEIGHITRLPPFYGDSVTLEGKSYLQSGFSTPADNVSDLLLPYADYIGFDNFGTVTSGFGSDIIWSVSYGNGVWIAVGDSGTMTRSTDDGQTWSTVTSGFGSDIIFSVFYGNGVWIAVGDSGTMTRSTDAGQTWSTVTSAFGSTRIWSVSYGNGVWIAVGDSGTMTRSTDDGQTWSTVTSGFGSTRIYSVSYGNGVRIAVGDSGAMTRNDQIHLALEFAGENQYDYLRIL